MFAFAMVFWLVILGAIVVGPHLIRWWWAPEKPTTFGSARYMLPEELRASGLLSAKNGIVLGRAETGEILRDDGEGHVLLCAPTRGAGRLKLAGKGTNTVLPTCFEWEGDLICVDPKNENYDIAGPWRHRCGNVVVSFNPMGEIDGGQINLLDTIRLGTRHALTDARILSQGFIPQPDAHETTGSAYYTRGGFRTLTAVLLYIRERGTDKTLGGARDFMYSDKSIPKLLKQMDQGEHKAVKEVVRELGGATDDAKKFWDAARNGLDLWSDPLVCERTQRSDVDLGAFQTSAAPMSLFLRSTEATLDILAPLMRTIVQVVINRCMERNPDRGRRKLLFLLDEFSSMGPCLPIVSALPRMAGFNMRCTLIVQDLTDITRLYGKYNNVVQNCATRCFMTAHDDETAARVSRLTGMQTIEYLAERSGTTNSPSGMSESESAGLLSNGRPLRTLDEILTLNERHLLIFLSGQHVLLAEKIRWDAEEYLDARDTPKED